METEKPKEEEEEVESSMLVPLEEMGETEPAKRRESLLKSKALAVLDLDRSSDQLDKFKESYMNPIETRWKREKKDKQFTFTPLTKDSVEKEEQRDIISIEEEKESPSTLEKQEKKSKKVHVSVFLILTGVLTALLGVTMDFTIDGLLLGRSKLIEIVPNIFLQFLVWILYTTTLLFAAVLLTKWIALTAAGSGIPEMKSMLSGVTLEKYLSLRALVSKIIGLVLALGSGLFLGKEGPFVHIACIIANQLSKIRLFGVKKGPFLQLLLGAACATGVAANFGAPVGGVLFSIEVTSTYYPLRNYWLAYLSSISGAVLFRYLWNLRFGNPGLAALLHTQFSLTYIDFGLVELVVFIALGIVCGLCGVLFIKMHSFLSGRYRDFMARQTKFSSPYFLASVIAITTAFFSFPGFIGDFMSLSSLGAIQDLYSKDSLGSASLNARDWGKFPVFVSLLLFAIIRAILTTTSMLLPVPCGLYIPLVAIGAAIGRFVGEIMVVVFPQTGATAAGILWEGGHIVAGGYALVGGAALSGAATHTLSSAVIAFEMTGQIHHLLPVLVAVTTAVAVARKFSSLSIYDSISRDKGLPYLPDLGQSDYDITAKDIMNTNFSYVTQKFQYDQILRALAKQTESKIFPVVDSHETMLLVGSVKRSELDESCQKYFDKHRFIQRELSFAGSQRNLQEMLKKYDKKISDHPSNLLESVDQTADVKMQSAPIQLLETTSLAEVHLLFITMRLSVGYVTRQGRVVGIVTRKALKQTIAKKDKHLTIFMS